MTDAGCRTKSAESGYEFRDLEKSDLRDVAALINRVFSAGVDAAYLDWKYFRNPAGNAISVVILFDRKIVGLLAALPMRFSRGGGESVAVEEVDLAVSEEHRRLDVYLRMVGAYTRRLISAKIAFTYSITGADAAGINQVIIGKKEVGRVPRLVRVLNAAPFLKKRSFLRPLAEVLSPVANVALDLRYAAPVNALPGLRLTRITGFDDRFDAFWQKARKDGRMGVVRDASYLNWRYAGRPGHQYEIAGLEKASGELEGYIVLGERREKGLQRGLIMDLAAPEPGAGFLLNHGVRYFRKKRMDAVECWMPPQCDVYPELIKSGFRLRQKEGMCLHFQQVTAAGEAGWGELQESDGWHISLGDSDLG